MRLQKRRLLSKNIQASFAFLRVDHFMRGIGENFSLEFYMNGSEDLPANTWDRTTGDGGHRIRVP